MLAFKYDPCRQICCAVSLRRRRACYPGKVNLLAAVQHTYSTAAGVDRIVDTLLEGNACTTAATRVYAPGHATSADSTHSQLFHRLLLHRCHPPSLQLLPCAAVALYHTLHASQLVPWLPGLPLIPIEPFQLTSFALSLLLVFRTNSSYSRWYEGRRRFGRVTTTCRDICRQVSSTSGQTSTAGHGTAPGCSTAQEL
jgi:hypothetical protein